MHAAPAHLVLLHRGSAARPDRPRSLHFSLSEHAGREGLAHTPVDLLVIDGRRMTGACLSAALAEAGRLRGATGVRHGVLVCEVPRLPVVVAALRAGLRDIVHEPLTARQLVQMLRAATPGKRACRHRLAALAAIVRTLAAGGMPAPANTAARREYELELRAEQLAHKETRLSLERAALEDREQKLRAAARQMERRFALDKNEAPSRPASATAGPFGSVSAAPFPLAAGAASAHPFGAPSLVADLQAIADRLEARDKALDIRERMLREMEALLVARPAEAPGRTQKRPPGLALAG